MAYILLTDKLHGLWSRNMYVCVWYVQVCTPMSLVMFTQTYVCAQVCMCIWTYKITYLTDFGNRWKHIFEGRTLDLWLLDIIELSKT